MKTLNERTEIARAINGHEMPVVVIDKADREWYGLKSKPVLVDAQKQLGDMPYLIKGEINVYSDDSHFKFSAEPVIVSASFGYSDMEEMLMFRNAPVIKADEDVIISIIDSKKKVAYKPIILHTSKHVRELCTEPLSFVDDDYDARIYLTE